MNASPSIGLTEAAGVRVPGPGETVLLSRGTNQARGLADYAIDFLFRRPLPIGRATLDRLQQFHLDSVGCGVSALALAANAPTVLRREAVATRPAAGSRGAVCFGAVRPSAVEKAVAANASAVREWDSNGTNFGYDAARGRTAGEFGHNDFYPVAVAAATEAGLDGDTTLRLMLLIDEIRGRLAEVFALRRYSIDHVHHGAVACAAASPASPDAQSIAAAQLRSLDGRIGAVLARADVKLDDYSRPTWGRCRRGSARCSTHRWNCRAPESFRPRCTRAGSPPCVWSSRCWSRRRWRRCGRRWRPCT